MKKLILLFIVSLPVYSQVKVQVVDPDLDSTPLEQNYQVEREAKNYNSIPDIDTRDALLSKIKATKGWDELKKDIFYMDLKSKSLTDLLKKYPEISLEQLKKLKEAHE